MASPRDQLVEELADAARTRSPEERAAFLGEACGGDPALRNEVEQLVSRRGTSQSPPDSSSSGTEAPTRPLAEEAAGSGTAPQRISSYRIVGVLGEGSMGVVYRAEQENPPRPVALKVLKAGGASSQALQRFEQEARMLGRLQHPGVAQIFEAGTADTGFGPQPFFAMELIQGVPLNVFADMQKLSIRERLALLVKVCAGVEHAHQKGVIHRDLKPGNILVDESGQPKILDFGIALAAGDHLGAAMSRSDLKPPAGTVPYMSLEQLRGDPDELDTRTDVYALGVIAYQLLTSDLPYDLKHSTIREGAQILAEQRPKPLGAIDRALRGDIEAIVDQALSRDKARRYQSASDLAADIRRYLSDEPILARPPKAIYQLHKFARRNKALVGSAAAVFLAVLVGLVGTGLGMRRALLAETKATAINDFLISDMLASAAPEELGKDVTVREVLDEAAEALLNGSLAGQPEVEAAVRMTLGMTYRSLGYYDKAEPQLRSAVEVNRHFLGDTHRQSLASMSELALLLKEQGKLEEAEPLCRRTLEAQCRTLGRRHPQTLETQQNLAAVLKTNGKVAEAESLYRQTLAVQREVLGDRHESTLVSMNSLALLLKSQGKQSDAEPLYQKVLEAQIHTLGNEHPHTLKSMNNLAAVLEAEDKLPEAARLYQETLASQQRILGNEHPDTLTSMNNLAFVFRRSGRLTEAEELYRETVACLQRTLGGEHLKTQVARHNLALVLQAQGKLDEAETLFRATVRFFRGKFGDRHRNTISPLLSLAVLLGDKGDYVEAESLHRHVLELRREILPARHKDIADSLIRLGKLLTKAGNPAGAEPLLREGVSIRQETLAEGHWQTANARSVLGGCLVRLQRFSEAEPLLLESYPVILSKWGMSDDRTQRALQRIIDLYDEAWGKPDQAAEFRAILPTSTTAEAPAP